MYTAYSESWERQQCGSKVIQSNPLTFTKGFKPCKDERMRLDRSELKVLKWHSLDLNPVLLTTNLTFPRCDHTGTKSSPAILTIRIRSSSRFLRTVANSCKDLAGKEKGAMNGSQVMSLRELFQTQLLCYGLKSLGTCRNLKSTASQGSLYLLIINH